MSSSASLYRVALIGDRMRINTFAFMRGVLDFQQHEQRGEIVGDRVGPENGTGP